ncbi:phytoene/squalene synthase family protein [Nocardiopsis composta]|uniref:Phytoene synthase n=1 Tax=Nocardiopsis composta TaxID=157465 RepID=A0A7W8QI99_9ACTN|nr:phytoene/squalene synthase family protein [Nocardiopsis composta]MBB5430987.1 phytoene synthase [Nocardiopsis composta]
MTGVCAELDAAGITGAALRRDYARSRALHARHGRTYYLATRVLPAARRPAVHALYGFARWVDDLVDEPEPGRTPERSAAILDAVEQDLAAALSGGRAREAPVRALGDTARRYAIPEEYFTAFMGSMRADLTVTEYADYGELETYMYGSAAVIGLQVLPVLGTVVPRAEAEPHAAALGTAFQLTNFLRDLAEDLDRGRVYLPADVLARHGVDRGLLLRCRRTGVQDARVRRALAELAELNRGLYRQAEPGCAMLSPVARPCVEVALRLYRGILEEIERADCDVWSRRHRVARLRRACIAAPALTRALMARASAP